MIQTFALTLTLAVNLFILLNKTGHFACLVISVESVSS